jgi:hypothetical protein
LGTILSGEEGRFRGERDAFDLPFAKRGSCDPAHRPDAAVD